jgi:hypothetical protein
MRYASRPSAPASKTQTCRQGWSAGLSSRVPGIVPTACARTDSPPPEPNGGAPILPNKLKQSLTILRRFRTSLESRLKTLNIVAIVSRLTHSFRVLIGLLRRTAQFARRLADAWETDRLISPQDIYRRDMNWLRECQLFIAEVSGSSFGLSFETGYLLGATTKKGHTALSL